METKANYFTVGLFVLALFFGLAVFAIWLGHFEFSDQGKRYRIFFQNSVNGLQVGSAVRLSGVPVGSVQSIKIDPNNIQNVEVIVDVDKTAPIKVDTYAQTELQGITGAIYIELEGGTQTSPALESKKTKREEEIPIIPVKASTLASLFEQAPKIMDKLNTVADRLTSLLSDENQQSLSNVIVHLDHFTATLDTAGPKLNTALDNTNILMGDLRQKLPKITSDIQATTTDFKESADELKGLIEENRKPLHEFTTDGLYEMSGLIGDLRTLSQSLTRVSGRLERNPGQFLFGSDKGGVPVQ